LLTDTFHAEGVRTVHEPVKLVAEFGRQDPTPTLMSGKIVSYQYLRSMIPIAFCRIDQIEPEFRALIENRVNLSLVEVLSPLPAKLPGPNANY
jgi:hypothetical protein